VIRLIRVLNVLHHTRSQLALLRNTHLARERVVRDPSSRSTGGSLLQHTIDLFEGKTLGFWDQDIRVDEAGRAEGTPEEEDLGAEIGLALVFADEVGSDDGDDAVPEPVGGGGETDTAGADGQWEDLTDEDPGTGTPGGGEEGDVDADEGDHGGDGRGVVFLETAGGDTDDGDDEFADQHTQRTPDEDGTTTVALNGIEGDGGAADVDESGDETDEEGVADGAECLEESGTEVEDEVDTGPLLHHLERSSEDSTAEVGGWVAETTLEAVHP